MPTSGEVTTNGGTTRQSLGLPAGIIPNTAFSCPEPTACIVGGIPLASWTSAVPAIQLLLTTTDGGATWDE